MFYRLLADVIVCLHLAFVGFVIFGGIFVVPWPRVAWAHLPAAVWGVFVEFSGLICPLTYLEEHLRRLGHQSLYDGDFIDHYVIPVLYPDGLTREIQFILGLGILALNLTFYAIMIRNVRRMRKDNPTQT